MFKKLIRKVLKPLTGRRAASIIAVEADKAIVKELDKHTGGAASKADKII